MHTTPSANGRTRTKSFDTAATVSYLHFVKEAVKCCRGLLSIPLAAAALATCFLQERFFQKSTCSRQPVRIAGHDEHDSALFRIMFPNV